MPLLDEKFSHNSIFKGLTPPQIQALNECASLAKYNPGDYIFERGKEANRFFMIKTGKVSLELYTPKLGAKSIQTLGSGDVMGTSWITQPSKWKMDAKALTEVELISFNAYRVWDKCDHDRDLGFALMSRFLIAISERLDASQNQILSLVQELAH